MMPDEKELRKRLRDDFRFYAPRCLKIRTKSGAIEALTLNAAQKHLHEKLNEQNRCRVAEFTNLSPCPPRLAEHPFFELDDLQNIDRCHPKFLADIRNVRPSQGCGRLFVGDNLPALNLCQRDDERSADVRSFRSPTRRENCPSTWAASTCTSSDSSWNMCF